MLLSHTKLGNKSLEETMQVQSGKQQSLYQSEKPLADENHKQRKKVQDVSDKSKECSSLQTNKCAKY